MSNQLRLLPTEASSRSESERPRRRRQQGPSAPAGRISAGRISTGTRRAGRQGIAEARRALTAAVTRPDADPDVPGVRPERELRRAG